MLNGDSEILPCDLSQTSLTFRNFKGISYFFTNMSSKVSGLVEKTFSDEVFSDSCKNWSDGITEFYTFIDDMLKKN